MSFPGGGTPLFGPDGYVPLNISCEQATLGLSHPRFSFSPLSTWEPTCRLVRTGYGVRVLSLQINYLASWTGCLFWPEAFKRVWRLAMSGLLLGYSQFVFKNAIGHFRVPPDLRIKTRFSVQPLIWKWLFILMQIKLIFTRKVVHLASVLGTRKWPIPWCSWC